jgi:general secretion pathway protein C
MIARLSALVIWALVAATAVFWGLRLWTRPAAAPANAVAVGDVVALRGDLSRLFGAPPVAVAAVAPEAASRFRLIGVIAPKASASVGPDRYGVALIAVDGQPPKAYPVGAKLDDDLVLQSVGMRSASIGPSQGAAALTLELPALPPPTTGKLPAPGAVGVPARTLGGVPVIAPQVLRQPPTQEPVPIDPNLGGAND